MFQCDKCDYSSTNKEECLAHEAKHFKLSVSDYEIWEQLTKNAERAGWVVGNTNNPETRKNFDEAIQVLVNFEQQHNLTDLRPSHF